MKKVALFLLLLMGGLIIYAQVGGIKSYSFTFQKIIPQQIFQTSDDLKRAVEDTLEDSEGKYAIFIKNFKTGEMYAKNENQIFEPASLYKVWVMGAVFEKIKTGEILENDRLSADIAALNKKFAIPEEDADLKEGVINFSIKSAVEQMITISHNYAALALVDKVGSKNVKEFMKKYELDNSSFDPPLKTTASEYGRFLEKLYQGEVINSEYSKKMIDVLSRQQKNDRIPKYLPKDIKVAHKTGELDNVRNDAGIVYSPEVDFSIVVLSETENVTDAAETIAQISKTVYDYFNK